MSSKIRLLVIIDDIDRLLPKEIRQIFQLVKGLAGLKNTFYLLAYDQEVVTKALKKFGGGSFVEKIVQMTYDIPLPGQYQLKHMFVSELFKLLESSPAIAFDSFEWENFVHNEISPFFQTPRDVKRLLNACIGSFPPLKDDVYFPDFVGVQCLRVFTPNVYRLIEKRPSLFTKLSFEARGWEATIFGDPTPKADAIQKALSGVFEPQAECAKKLVEWLFPSDSRNDTKDIRQKRVRESGNFSRYFELNVPKGEFRHSELLAILEAFESSPSAAGVTMVELASDATADSRSRLTLFFDWLIDAKAIDALDSTARQNLFVALLDVGDDLSRLAAVSEQATVILLAILANERTRVELLKQSLPNARAVSTVTNLLKRLNLGAGRFGANAASARWSIDSEILAQMDSLAADVVRRAAVNGSLVSTPNLHHVLYWWEHWESPEVAEAWLQERICEFDSLPSIIRAFMLRVESFGADDVVPRVSEIFQKNELVELAGIPMSAIQRSALRHLSTLAPGENPEVRQLYYVVVGASGDTISTANPWIEIHSRVAGRSGKRLAAKVGYARSKPRSNFQKGRIQATRVDRRRRRRTPRHRVLLLILSGP